MEESIHATMAASWGAVDFDWRIIPLLIFGWYLLLKRWERDGVLDRWNATRVFGFVLMVRTKRGLDLLEKVAKPRKFWRIYGEISLWVCTFAMFMVALVMLLVFVGALLSPPDVPPPTASELVAIPGINPMIPLWWGLIGFIVALVIHEFGHGLLARGHGMRIRSFGLLQLGPLPLGAFAEPEGEELFKAPRRERQRMFAAGPATNLFAAFVLLLLLGGIAGQFASDDQSIHVTGIVKGEGADEAGMLPWDTIETIQGEDVVGLDGFRDIVEQYNAGDSVLIGVLHQDGTRETVNATFSDKYTYYQNQGFSEEQLESFSIEQGDPFLGVEGLSSNTAGIDRLAGPLSPNVEYTTLQRTLIAPLHVVTIMIIPFEFQGVAMHPNEEAMLQADDTLLGNFLGKEGLLVLVNLLFWMMWVNVLLGFTNLIPMVPFDGGHMFKDMVHAGLSRVRAFGRKLKLWNFHPLWVDQISRKASNLSSLGLLFILLFILIIPYF